MRFGHCLLTRFSVAVLGRRFRDRAWLDKRFELFERFCLPSVQGQSSQNFEWFVFFDSSLAPDLRVRVAGYSSFPRFHPEYVNGPFRHDTARKVLRDFAASHEYLITSRLDNDDALAKRYIELVQSRFHGQTFEFINFPNGYLLDGDQAYSLRHPSNAFISLIEKSEGFQTVLCGNHAHLSELGPIRQIERTPGWLQVVHDANAGNTIRGTPVSTGEWKRHFSIPHIIEESSRREQMRILWITGNFYPTIGGIQVYVERLTNSLADLDEVAVVTESEYSSPQNVNISHYVVGNLNRPPQPEDWEQARLDISAVVDEFQPDVVHFATANLALYRSAVPAEIPAFATVHGNDLTSPWQKTPGRETVECIVEGLNSCDHVIAVSNHTADLAREWGVNAPLSVFTSGCDLAFFQPDSSAVNETRAQYGIPDDVPIILTVGRLVPRKGHFYVLEALRELTMPVCWLIAGDGALRESLSQAIEHYQMGDRVLLLGEVSSEDLRLLYNACDLFVLTPDERDMEGRLDSEGFGLVYHEAGACGKPVIASDISGCKEAVLHGITGLLVPPADPQALAESIHYLLTNRQIADSLGRGGLAFVQTLGGWSRLAWQIHDMYAQALVRA